MAYGRVARAGRQRRLRLVRQTHCKSNLSPVSHALGNKHGNRDTDDNPAPYPDRDGPPNRHRDRDAVAESHAQCNCLSHRNVYPIPNPLTRSD